VIEVGETFSSSTFKIKDSTGAPGAASVSCVVTLPDATTSAPTVTTPALGDYVFDYLTTVAGRHPYVVTATGGVLGSLVRKFADTFTVAGATSTGIVSLEEAKNHLNIPLSNTNSDTEIELFIASATDKIEHRTGPVVRRIISNERHCGGERAVWLHEAPIISVTSVIALDSLSTINVADLGIDPAGRVTYFPTIQGGARFPYGEHLWTYVAGTAVVPAGLRLAALNFVKGAMETQRGMSGLPWKGAQDQPVEVPGMGLVIWRLEQDLQPFLRWPGGGTA
jgi:hypothetical protein